MRQTTRKKHANTHNVSGALQTFRREKLHQVSTAAVLGACTCSKGHGVLLPGACLADMPSGLTTEANLGLT